MEKKFIKLCGLVIFSLLVLAACGQAEDSTEGQREVGGDERTRIVIADAITTHHLNLYVAYELGFFEEAGLDVEILTLDDNAAARDAVVSGQADIFWSCPTIALAAIANGAPLTTVAQVKTPCTSVLAVPAHSDIESFADLAGRQIGGISPACEAVLALAVAARNEGVSFNLETLAGGPAIAALEAGQIEGALLEEPHASIAELAGFNLLFRDVSDAIPCRTINGRNVFVENNAEAMERFVAAVDRANAIINEDPTADEIVDIAVAHTGAPRDAVIHGNHRLIFHTDLAVDGLILLADELVYIGNIPENPGEAMFAEQLRGTTW
ncbi:MAG: ABC transporter substrate-binding protein [Defluviitaleaceae bacterium]|nr:ABC transporter substrate-binding protein [Defluviitaleaceae bacterium]